MRAPWNGPIRVPDGKTTADVTKVELAERIATLRERGVVPGLDTTPVGEDPGSVIYAVGKHYDYVEVGIEPIRVDLSASVTQEQIEATMDHLNASPACTGYVVQFPLPRGIDQNAVLEQIDPEKNTDGLHPTNLGRLVPRGSGSTDSPFSCTPRAVIELMTRHGIGPRDKHTRVVGRGVTVGRFIRLFLVCREVNATVTVCHAGTKDLTAQIRQADVAVTAVGSVDLIMKDMAKPGTVILDVDVSRIVGEDGKSRLTGDVADGVNESVSWLSPSPEGVGPMTRALFVTNVVEVAKRGAK